jgi:hypothetical protein
MTVIAAVVFISVQSQLAARNTRQPASRKATRQAQANAEPGVPAAPCPAATLGGLRLPRSVPGRLLLGAGALVAIVLGALAINDAQNAARGGSGTPTPHSAP